MKYFEKKQIHSSCSSASSRDIYITREISKEVFDAFDPDHQSVAEKYGFSVAYSEDKRFYNLGISHNATPEEMMIHVAQNYLPDTQWKLENRWLDAQQKKQWADEDAERTAKRTKQGFVIPKWSADIPPADYQGGFSDAVFNEPHLQDYLRGGGCHGYIGHSARHPQLDRHLEKKWLALNPDTSLLAMWLTSSGGRHFADWKEGDTIKAQKDYITESIGQLIAQAQGYRQAEA